MPALDPPLKGKTIEHIRNTREAVAKIQKYAPFDVVISSPYRRCFQTAQFIVITGSQSGLFRETVGIPVIEIDCSVGEYLGHQSKRGYKRTKLFTEATLARSEDGANLPPFNEASAAMAARARMFALQGIMESKRNQIVISHGVITDFIFRALFGTKLDVEPLSGFVVDVTDDGRYEGQPIF
jgi:broad specificity phosphatase PhoE